MKSRFQYRGSYLSYVVTYFSYFFAMSTINNMISLYLTDLLGKTDQEMTFIISASSLFGIITNPIIGYLNDKFRKPKVLAATLLSCAAVSALLFAAFRNTILLYILNGLTMGCISAVSPISERVASSGKFRYGQIRIWGTIGYAAAPQVAGIILEIAPPRWLFITAAISLVISSGSYLLLKGISFEASESTEPAEPQPAVKNRLSFFKTPMFLLFACIAMLYSGAAGLNNSYCPILL
ncbi:MAG: MFS transporter, partial [Clostridia bacterium]|nr:MFS transporter [Clostridia bacterium]